MTGDTIAAIATPVGPGGVGVVRVSGPRAVDIVAGVVGRTPAELPDRVMVYGVARGAGGGRIDDVLVVAMRGPRSFTGQDVGEIHGHGGAWNMRRLLREVIERGARHAEAGEFTRRAFEAGKVDLTRAEALLGVIEAGSERAWRISQAQLAGAVGDRVAALRARGTELLAEVEATIDFPEDDVDFLAVRGTRQRAAKLAGDTDALAASYSLGRAVRDGLEVAVVGPVNAGKSSLVNALVGEERVIVTDEPGTTRDYVEARTVWEGIPVMLIDTAGDREAATSAAEALGQERGRARASRADVRVRLHPVDAADSDPQSADEIHVVSKVDLAAAPEGQLATSALTGAGIDELRAAILERAVGVEVDEDAGVAVTSERQFDLLRRAAAGFRRASAAVAKESPVELVALELREGCDALAELRGEAVGEDVLDALFARFCIGK